MATTAAITPSAKHTVLALAGAILLVSLLAAPSGAIAQPQLTPSQMQQLQSLSADDQATIQAQLGGIVGERQSQIPEAVGIRPAAAAAAPQAEVAIEEDVQQRQQQDDITTDQASQSTASTALRQFGYELFAGSPSTFAPATNIPVPATYVMGPGDTVVIQLYGQRNVIHELVITREGMLLFPEIGPVSVAGLSFLEMRDQIQRIVTNQLIGQNATVTLGALRSINVFVLGEAAQPGSFTVSSLSTMTNALFASGGVTRIGSLRGIRLMRSGQLVTELDLYDLLLRGDTSGDARLMPGDVIFIPPIGKTVGIAGEVRRPAIYELKNETSPAEILSLSGGLNPTAYPRSSRIERISDNGERIIVDVDLSLGSAPDPVLNDGDVIQVYSVLDQLENIVLLEGHVHRPGSFQWREGLRVSGVLGSVEEMLPNPDLDYALIAREILPTRRIELVYVNLGTAINNPGSATDLLLQPRDQLLTFGASQSRQAQVAQLLSRLRAQASFEKPALIVSVSGNVRFPGEYPLVRGMTMDDVIRFAGGLSTDSDLDYVLLERQIDRRGSIGVQSAALNGETLQTPTPIALQELDRVMVFNANESRDGLLDSTLSKLKAQASSDSPTLIARISGNVRFPGEYPLTRGLSAGGLIQAAGGFTESADTTAAEVTRYDSELEAGRSISHIVVNLTGAGRSGLDLSLMPFDQLTIRQMPNWTASETVTLSGEVMAPGVYTITKEDTLTSLIRRAGGLTDYADPRAAIFLREELRANEQQALDDLRARLQRDLVIQGLQGASEENGAQTSVEPQVLALIDNAEATGRLTIDLPTALSDERRSADYDVILRDGDRLLIPRTQQEITVAGEVNQPTSHLYRRDWSVSDYIASSGGYTPSADQSNVFVIKASGEVVSFKGARWFFQKRARMEPGDTIVVPFNTRIGNNLVEWRNISQILFNLSTTLLAIERVGV